jgi:glycosyltransferase involved in cell wall biosynthesis
MDLFAFPSQSEGFGLALLEAMACGLPAVTTDQSGTQDVVRNGETAFMSHSLTEFEQTLRLLIADAELRRRMGGAARDGVVRSQSWAAVARQTADAYRQVMHSHGQAAS